MNNIIMLLLVLLSGAGMSVQSGVNGELGKKIGTIEGAFISFFIGCVALMLLMFFMGKGNVTQVFQVPKWQLFGGLIGAFYVFMMVFSVPRLGVGTFVVCAIVGQIVMSLAIDHFGWFGRQPIELNWQRILGGVLLFAALLLIYSGNTGTSKQHAGTKAGSHRAQPVDSIVSQTANHKE